MSLHTWHHQAPCNPNSCTTFALNPHWGRDATDKTSCIYACSVTSLMSSSLRPCGLWPVRLLCEGGFSRQYWSELANTGCHTFIEDYMSYCPSQNTPRSTWCCQNPCDSSICTSSTPGPHPSPRETQVLQDSLRSKPQWMTPCRGGNKTIIETQGQCG